MSDAAAYRRQAGLLLALAARADMEDVRQTLTIRASELFDKAEQIERGYPSIPAHVSGRTSEGAGGDERG